MQLLKKILVSLASFIRKIIPFILDLGAEQFVLISNN